MTSSRICNGQIDLQNPPKGCRSFHCVFTATNCSSPNLTIITYKTGRHDNFFCAQECGKLPGGRLAVPRTQTQYDCLTGISGHARTTPFWTGIRVRQTGGLFDPLTRNPLPILGNRSTGFTCSSVYRTVHGEWKVHFNKSEACIYLHNNYYVEAGCSFTHKGRRPIQCACYTGNLKACCKSVVKDGSRTRKIAHTATITILDFVS